jgi:hypothetical protein
LRPDHLAQFRLLCLSDLGMTIALEAPEIAFYVNPNRPPFTLPINP